MRIRNYKESLDNLVRRARPDIDFPYALERVRSASTSFGEEASEFVVENTGKVILGATAAYAIARGVGHYLRKRR